MLGFKRSMVQTVIFLTWAVQNSTYGSLLWYIFAVTLGSATVLALLTYDHDYWSRRGIFSPPAWPLVGHIRTVATFKEQGGMCFKRIYDKYKHLRFLGTHQFFQRTLVVQDPELIKRICVNDFHHFTDRGFFFNKELDPLAGSVLFLRGNEWKKLRAKISPIFSPNKLRGMFPLIENTANEFIIRIRNIVTKTKNTAKNRVEVEDNHTDKLKENVKEVSSAMVVSEELVGGYTADAIVPCAFGLKSGVMDNPNDPFAVALHAFYEMTPWNIFEKTMRQFWPAFVLFFRMRIIPKKTHDFFYNIVTSVLRARENGEQEKRGDFIDMMMALQTDDRNNNAKADDNDVEITDMVIAANAFIIFLGGYETTSSTLAFLFLELAAHPHVQETMRQEIEEVMERHGGKASYEVLQELTYMEMVIQETLRLYPPFPSIQRLCTKDYMIPNSDRVIEKGTVVLFPTLGIQRDDQFFEKASKFLPERWSEGQPSPPPGVYMPFGDGPRYCIGKRFAVIQMKSCLLHLLRNIRISPVSSKPREGPFEADPRFPLTLHPADSRVKLSLL
ncbi:cytochrome P450 6j1-like [Epargyreus clarus]|uniref:cytochrome P450 6j1-like n=1 Tax=Epargyreus clarus TaxID=520877 RepID=UPI003C2D49FC